MTDIQAADKPKTTEAYDALAEAKLLLRSIRAGALATLVPQEGFPFASLVNVATDFDGSPILLLSSLAAHTRHLAADDRVSLLLPQSGQGDPLAHPRLTIVGRGEQQSDPESRAKCKARFLNRHPKSALYADFADFSFWRIVPYKAHLNGGFGRAGNFPAERIMTGVAGAEALVAAEADALEHINKDHAAALALYATALAGQQDGAWHATGIDPEGLDLAWNDLTARIVFPQPVQSADALRKILAALAEQARAAL
jgi:putative heme iron utilization protein